MKVYLCAGLLSLSLSAADPAVLEMGKAEEKRACTSCHGLRISHVQRLTKAQWDRELTKMAGWGAAIKERDALLAYLVANFGDDRPAAELERTGNGAGKK